MKCVLLVGSLLVRSIQGQLAASTSISDIAAPPDVLDLPAASTYVPVDAIDISSDAPTTDAVAVPTDLIPADSTTDTTVPTDVVAEPTDVFAEPTDLAPAASSTDAVVPTDVVAEPTDVVAEPTDVVAQPTDVVAEPTDVVAEPTDVVAQPTDVVAEPTDVVAEPTDVVAEPTDVVAEPTDVVAEPTDLAPVASTTDVAVPTDVIAPEPTDLSSDSTSTLFATTTVVLPSPTDLSPDATATDVFPESSYVVAPEPTLIAPEPTVIAPEPTYSVVPVPSDLSPDSTSTTILMETVYTPRPTNISSSATTPDLSPDATAIGPPGWDGQDNSYYDGEGMDAPELQGKKKKKAKGTQTPPDDSDDCPSWCYDKSVDRSWAKSRLRRFAQAVPSSGGFQDFMWPSGSASAQVTPTGGIGRGYNPYGNYGDQSDDGLYNTYGNYGDQSDDGSSQFDNYDDLPDWLKSLYMPPSTSNSRAACPAKCYAMSTSSTPAATSTGIDSATPENSEVTPEVTVTDFPSLNSEYPTFTSGIPSFSSEYPVLSSEVPIYANMTSEMTPEATATELSSGSEYTALPSEIPSFSIEVPSTFLTILTSTAWVDEYPPFSSMVPLGSEIPSTFLAISTSTAWVDDYPDFSSMVPLGSEIPSTFLTISTSAAWVDSAESTSAPVNEGDSWTGDTLAQVCPKTCDPINPTSNFCDITTGCATTGGTKYNCACRAGYRFDGVNPKDFSKQFRVPGQPYVYGTVNATCNTLCSDSVCSEVLVRPQCV